MNNLFLHIEYLILRHECVVVPGFGAFICRQSPAVFDFEKGVILPPSRTLAFNRAVSMDDGLLANSYVRKYGMSPEEARLAIVRAASILHEHLDSERRVVCGNLGVLSMDEEDRMIFSPSSDPLANTAFSEVPLSIAKETDTPAESPVSEESTASGYYHFSISKRFTRIAAVLFAVCAVCLTVILNPIPADDREQRASVLPVESLISVKSEMPEKETAAEVSSLEIQENENPEIPEVEKMHSHYLIVGTFSTEKEARRFSESCDKGEFSLEIVPSRKVSRVAAAASDSREEMREILNSAECRKRFPGAWIWTRP